MEAGTLMKWEKDCISVMTSKVVSSHWHYSSNFQVETFWNYFMGEKVTSLPRYDVRGFSHMERSHAQPIFGLRVFPRLSQGNSFMAAMLLRSCGQYRT